MDIAPPRRAHGRNQGLIVSVSGLIGRQVYAAADPVHLHAADAVGPVQGRSGIDPPTASGGSRALGPGDERVGQQIIAFIHETVNGLVLVGLGEGVLLCLVYALTEVPRPTLFGTLTAVAAKVPFAAPVIFSVAAILLLPKDLSGGRSSCSPPA
jgi:hypothetical protein